MCQTLRERVCYTKVVLPMQQIPARSDNFDIIQHSDQPTIVQNQHLACDVIGVGSRGARGAVAPLDLWFS